MQLSRYIHGFLAVLASCALLSCAFDDHVPADTPAGAETVVTFYPTLDDALSTKTIGDATRIDQLRVAVYEKTGSTREHRFTLDYAWNVAQAGLQLTLIEGRTYDILFWAQCKDNKAYTLSDAGQIQVNYTDYLAGGFAKMEELDAFYATSSVTVGSTAVENKGAITLTRPLAQLNFADNATQPVQGSHCTKLTFHAYPTALDPFSKTVAATTADLTFIFEDYPTETLSAQGATYYYVATNYFFAPYIISKATLDFQDNQGNSIKSIVVDDLLMEPNKKTNVLGSIVGTPTTWSVWDGTIPTESTLTMDSENRYIIDEAADIAWLGVNASTLETGKTILLTIDIDMAAKSGLSSIQLPSGSTLDGQKHTIKGVRLSGALFGNATELVMKDLTLEDVQVSSPDSHAGVLVNTLKGSGSFSGIHIKNSSVVSSTGAAGGLVGYVVRKSANDRSEALEVVFDDCHVEGSSVTGSLAQGHFVGLLRGYDAGEVLRFNDNCTYVASASASLATGPVSPYCEGNEGAWLAENDYSPFNGWLGNEECYRGQVFYGTQRFIPRWDGTTKIEPLLADATYDANVTAGTNRYMVYSAYDLAGLRNKTAAPAALYLMENVDMFGQGEDGEFFVHSNFTKSACNSADDNNFDAFSSIALLEGNGKAIYNLALNSKGSDRYAFILSGDNGHVHQNVSFYNSCTVVPHIVGKDGDQTVDKSYGATVVLSIGGATYNMKNIHAYDCKVFALQKTGIIAGRIVSSGMATLENCSVTNGYIENYKCEEHIEIFKRDPITAEFYSYGEIGGLVGFVDYNATIKGCKVLQTKLDAYGQGEKSGKVTVSGRQINLGSIPGRHVNQFIGDIRSREGYSVTITDAEVSSNLYNNRKDEHEAIIGRAYYLGASVWLILTTITIGDKPGTVSLQNINVDGSVKYTSKKNVTLKSVLG